MPTEEQILLRSKIDQGKKSHLPCSIIEFLSAAPLPPFSCCSIAGVVGRGRRRQTSGVRKRNPELKLNVHNFHLARTQTGASCAQLNIPIVLEKGEISFCKVSSFSHRKSQNQSWWTLTTKSQLHMAQMSSKKSYQLRNVWLLPSIHNKNTEI